MQPGRHGGAELEVDRLAGCVDAIEEVPVIFSCTPIDPLAKDASDSENVPVELGGVTLVAPVSVR